MKDNRRLVQILQFCNDKSKMNKLVSTVNRFPIHPQSLASLFGWRLVLVRGWALSLQGNDTHPGVPISDPKCCIERQDSRTCSIDKLVAVCLVGYLHCLSNSSY